MLAVLAEARAMREARSRVIADMRAGIAVARAEAMSADEALAMLVGILDNSPEPSWQATAVEAYHFRRNAGRNEREARRMRRRRGVAAAVGRMPEPEPLPEPPDAITADEAEAAFMSGAVTRPGDK
jgi:hypothetical protein